MCVCVCVCVCVYVFTVDRCFSMIRYEAFMLVDLLPPFLKTYEFGLRSPVRRRRLAEETSAAVAEVGTLEQLTRALNALQVTLVIVIIATATY